MKYRMVDSKFSNNIYWLDHSNHDRIYINFFVDYTDIVNYYFSRTAHDIL